jgi:hypothetical protein
MKHDNAQFQMKVSNIKGLQAYKIRKIPQKRYFSMDGQAYPTSLKKLEQFDQPL